VNAPRAAAGALALAAVGGLGFQAAANHAAGGTAAVLDMLGFFTILTNILLALVMGRVALTGRRTPATVGFVVVQIAVVGLVYHAVLAHAHHPRGAAAVANFLLHTATPLGMLAFWLGFAPRVALRWRAALVWLLWPLGFCAISLLRGAGTGWYPYFFLDPARLGWHGVGAAILALSLLFVALGLAVVGVERRRATRAPR